MVTENSTSRSTVRVRITAPPDPTLFDEYDVGRYKVGEVFEFPVRLATLLILAGCAEEIQENPVTLPGWFPSLGSKQGG